MSISFVLVQCTIGHEMEVLRDLLELDSVKEAKGGEFGASRHKKQSRFCSHEQTFLLAEL